MRRTFLLLLLLFALNLHAQDTEALRQRLLQTGQAGQVFMGHHDDTFYGHAWATGACERSDLEELCGHRPAFRS